MSLKTLGELVPPGTPVAPDTPGVNGGASTIGAISFGTCVGAIIRLGSNGRGADRVGVTVFLVGAGAGAGGGGIVKILVKSRRGSESVNRSGTATNTARPMT